MNLNYENIRYTANLVEPIARELAPQEWQSYVEVARESILQKKPVIMLYGMFSHGKSTVINALLGKEAAEIGKPPTTDKIRDYIWEAGNCILRDTPGIQARQADTLLADESLRQCALVAFVVESGSIEERVVWETLARMLKQKQKVCIIINDFDDCRKDPRRLGPLKEKLRQFLQQAAEKENFSGNIVKQTPIMIMDAKHAAKGHIEHKVNLAKDAGLPETERAMIDLASSLSNDDIINVLKRNLVNVIDASKHALALDENKKILAEPNRSWLLLKTHVIEPIII